MHFVCSLCGFLSGNSGFLSQTKNTRLFRVCVDGMHALWKTSDLSGTVFSLTQQQLTENGWLCSIPMMHWCHTRRRSFPGQGRSMSECMFSPYLCGFYLCKLLQLKNVRVRLGFDDFLKFLKKDSWMLLRVLISFCRTASHSFVLLSDNVQVKYRSRVVKYTWPMPHQAESIPWVQIRLANGDTLQTKLLVSWILSYP